MRMRQPLPAVLPFVGNFPLFRGKPTIARENGEVWGRRAGDSRNERKLDALLRPFLLSMLKAYRTAPTSALYVMAGIPPLSIQAFENYRLWKDKQDDQYVQKTSVACWPHPACRTREEFVAYPPACWHDCIVYTDGSKLDGRVGPCRCDVSSWLRAHSAGPAC